MNTNAKKKNTNKQTNKKNQKQKLVSPLANFKAQALLPVLLDEERELDISGSKVLCDIWQMKFTSIGQL